MSIPINDHLLWNNYIQNPKWHEGQSTPSSVNKGTAKERAISELSHILKQPYKRGEQFIRDFARLVLKVPIRAVLTPVILPKNWKERQRAKINAKLTGYSFVQLVSVPCKFLVALAAILASAMSFERMSSYLIDKSQGWTAHLDGRASQLEALKEEAGKNAKDREEYDQYKTWLYSIDPKLCRKF